MHVRLSDACVLDCGALRPSSLQALSLPLLTRPPTTRTMSSPIERASPALSDSSDDAPDHEVEELAIREDVSAYSFQHGPGSFNGLFGGSSKRRLPGGAAFGASSARDPKSRRKDVRAGGSIWEQGPGPSRSQRDDTVDPALVDQLRSRECFSPLSYAPCPDVRTFNLDGADRERRVRRSVR